MKFNSKKEMAQALLDGRRFRNHLGAEIHYDENELIPFRITSISKDYIKIYWNVDEFEWIEIKEWYEDLSKGRVCWVWDHNQEAKIIRLITEYLSGVGYKFNDDSETPWKYAEPVEPGELGKYMGES